MFRDILAAPAVGSIFAVRRVTDLDFSAIYRSFDPCKESIVGRQRGDPFRKERDRRFESGSLQ